MAGVLTVAAYICGRYESEFGKIIDEMKLHKLMYFAQRESLIQTGEPLFRATFRGWKYGPVLKELREPYQNQELLPKVKEKDAAAMAPVMDKVFSDYAPKDSMSLSRLTHGEISWKRSRKGVTPAENSDKPISLGDIRLDAQRIRDRREKLDQQGLL